MKRFQSLLLVADGKTGQVAALRRAFMLARNNQASVTVVDVVPSIPPDLRMAITAVTPTELRAIAIKDAEENLSAQLRDVDQTGISVTTKVLVGKPFVEIIRQVVRGCHDLVIKCAEESVGIKARLFGSTDMNLMRKCPCPVWVIKAKEPQRYRRILAAVDQDPDGAVKDGLNRQILEVATSLALTEFGELHIVHAWQLFAESYLRSPRLSITDAEVDAMAEAEGKAHTKWLEQLVKTYATNVDQAAVDYLEPKLHVLKGDAARVVPKLARDYDIDVIIMGTLARSGITGLFMGNTAETILSQLDCSVLTVKPPGFVGPIALDD